MAAGRWKADTSALAESGLLVADLVGGAVRGVGAGAQRDGASRFYDFHLGIDDGPILIDPFPLDHSRRGGRANAHHNPMEPFADKRAGLYRPQVPKRVPRFIPDEEFNEFFARLPSHRDRALVAFYVSTGARTSELLSTTQGGVDPGRQLSSLAYCSGAPRSKRPWMSTPGMPAPRSDCDHWP
ncbi:hypothetical protein [Nonomuraea sp. CA-141351]|uniref:hypothetical protein n=1 Tax=Nonomuraea sp. CA-141351 TaxID=3239996 RepID=UPI003D9398B4